MGPFKTQIGPFQSWYGPFQSEGLHPTDPVSIHHPCTEGQGPNIPTKIYPIPKTLQINWGPHLLLRAPWIAYPSSPSVTGGPKHQLRVTTYWWPRKWTEPWGTERPTDPLSIRVTEGSSFCWGPHWLTVHLGLWGPHTMSSEGPQIDSVHLGLWGSHTLSSEGPQIDCPSRPLRAPHTV